MLTTTTSCSDFLDEDPKGQMSEANVFKSQADLDASIHTIYEKLNQTQSWTNPMYPQWQGDDMTANPSSNKQAVAALDVFSSDGENKGVKDAWSQHFALIKACNWVIENASKTPTSQEEINIALGNAHFWRAYAYFYMVRIFGPLPMVVTTDPSATNVAPSSVEEIYNLIVDDLKKAEGWLPTSYSQAPRNHDGVDAWVTKQATQATLTAVYMAMAGYPLNKGKEYYALAAAKAKEVIDNNGTYGFYNDPVWNHVYSMGPTTRRPSSVSTTTGTLVLGITTLSLLLAAASRVSATVAGAMHGAKSHSGSAIRKDRVRMLCMLRR